MKRLVIIFFLTSLSGFADELTIDGKTYYSDGSGPGGQDIPTPMPPPDTGEAPQLKPDASLDSFGGGETTEKAFQGSRDLAQEAIDLARKQQVEEAYQRQLDTQTQNQTGKIINQKDESIEKIGESIMGLIENYQKMGIKGDDNPSKIDKARENIKKILGDMEVMKNWRPETLRWKTIEALSPMNKSIILDYLKKGRYEKAKKYFNDHSDEIDFINDSTEIYTAFHRYRKSKK